MPNIDCIASNIQSNNCNNWNLNSKSIAESAATVCPNIKTENATECTTPTVVHRKSERRKIARDIFLVFEEQPKRKTSYASKKPIKSKFAHLNIEELFKKKPALFRDIKNEPPRRRNSYACSRRTDNLLKMAQAMCSSSSPPISKLEKKIEPQNATVVEPIFLWVKQDDTRIIEVRCEDYDKRNRIRITKTTNGWRATPRSDATSSRIAQFLKSPSLFKVKHENAVVSNSTASAAITNALKQTNTSKQRIVLIEKEKQKSNTELSALTYSNFKIPALPLRPLQVEKQAIVIEAATETAAAIETINFKSLNTLELKPRTDAAAGVAEITQQELMPHIEQKDNAQTYQLETSSLILQLCPKTGLFLPPEQYIDAIADLAIEGDAEVVARSNSSSNSDVITTTNNDNNNIHDTCLVSNISCEELTDCLPNNPNDKETSNKELLQCLDAETDNLKDLLDSSDLLQNCVDHTNSCAELIDSLVQRSCDTNLIDVGFFQKNTEALNTLTASNCDSSSQESPQPKTLHTLPYTTDDFSVTPKCLSFNEAGVIERLNEELYVTETSNRDIFEMQQQQQQEQQKTNCDSITANLSSSVPTATTSPISAAAATTTTSVLLQQQPTEQSNITAELPTSNSKVKEVNSKQIDNICTSSDSRSQCAVTSSSDIIIFDDDVDDDNAVIDNGVDSHETSNVESASETIKSFIMDQCVQVNKFKKTCNSQTNLNSSNAIVLDGLQANNISAMLSPSTTSSSCNETVVIEDTIDEPVVKKRMCNLPMPANSNLCVEGHNFAMSDLTNISNICVNKPEDPDPLTQLQLLINSTEWKVPDPILVPKDRLSAVLASPAREIPLLITTRPELRLPEAFAFPEIIKNPNILVISMAQLEAILKSDSKLKQLTHDNVSGHNTNVSVVTDSGLSSSANVFTEATIHNNDNPQATTSAPSQSSAKTDEKFPFMEASLAADVNAAAMLMLNQMLWLPYFEQLSQALIKTLNKPTEPQNKFNSMLPLFNPQIGLHHLDQIYKVYMKQISGLQSLNKQAPNIVVDKKQLCVDTEQQQQQQQLQNLQISQDLCEHPSTNVNNDVYMRDEKQLLVAEKKPRLTCKSLVNLLEPTKLNATVSTSTSSYHSSSNSNTKESMSGFLKGNKKAKEQSVIFNTCSTMPISTECADRSNANDHFPNMSDALEACRKDAKLHIPKDTLPTDTSQCALKSMDMHNNDLNVNSWNSLFGSKTKAGYSSPWQWTTLTAAGE